MPIKNRQQWLAIFAGAAVSLFAADKLLLAPLTASYRARAARITELSRKVADGQSLLQHERSWRDRWDRMRANTLPDNTSQAEQKVLKAFDRWSENSGISILSISPQLKHDSEDHSTIECRVEAAGDLSAVTRFLHNLETDSMALKLQSVEISSRDNDGQQLALGLQVSALILTPEPTPARTQARR